MRAGTGITPRAAEILDAAAGLLEERGRDALTMRSLAERIGIRAPSLYKHFQSKEQIEAALVERGVEELRVVVSEARRAADPIGALAVGVVRFSAERPHLFTLLAERPLAPLLAGDGRERALLVFVQGMVALEGSAVGTPGDATDAWNHGLAGFRHMAGPRTRTVVTSVRGPD